MPSTQNYQSNPIPQHPQRTTVNTANLAQIPQVENPFVAEPVIQANATLESGGSDEPKAFLHRTKKKASAREIRQRQNRRLRKLLTPKNALMALYELIGNKNCDFKINADAKGFLAEVLVNNVRYEGRGIFSVRNRKIKMLMKSVRFFPPKVLLKLKLKMMLLKRHFAI